MSIIYIEYIILFFTRRRLEHVYSKRDIRSLLSLPLAGLLFMLLGTQQIAAAPVDSLLPERSEQEISQKWTQWMSGKNQTATFTENPSTKAPYVAGVVSDSTLEQALGAANFYRYLSGLEGDLVLDSALNRQAQHGAVVVSTGELTHFPARPADMPKDFLIWEPSRLLAPTCTLPMVLKETLQSKA